MQKVGHCFPTIYFTKIKLLSKAVSMLFSQIKNSDFQKHPNFLYLSYEKYLFKLKYFESVRKYPDNIYFFKCEIC